VLTAASAFWSLRAYRTAGGGANSPTPSLAICAVVALIALTAYLVIGRPELPDAPYAARLAALSTRDPTTFSPDETLAVLDRAAKQHPNDARPHLFSGEVLLEQGQPEEAAREFDAALRRDPRSAEAMMGLGRAIVRINGRVTPEALAQFQQAAARTNDPAPWIYQAMAAMQDNRATDARHFWSEAYARMRPDDPRREMARRMSTEAP
jgi:cytochrome c-type biogenesis protein CcmH